MDISTLPVCTAAWQASKLMGLTTRLRPISSAMNLARVTSKPTYWSWPLLETSTNSMGAQSGEMATVRDLAVIVFKPDVPGAGSGAAVGAVSGALVSAGCSAGFLAQPPRHRAASSTSASANATIFFISLSFFLVWVFISIPFRRERGLVYSHKYSLSREFCELYSDYGYLWEGRAGKRTPGGGAAGYPFSCFSAPGNSRRRW